MKHIFVKYVVNFVKRVLKRLLLNFFPMKYFEDLLPTVKNSSHAFIRVTFFNRCKQTLVVANSQNPVWNETIILDKVEDFYSFVDESTCNF